MAIDGVRHIRRHEAGQQLKKLIQQQIGAFEDRGHQPSRVGHGHLAGFEVTAAIRRVHCATQITLELDGAPGCAMTTTPDALDGTDPARLIVGMENRLAGLEKGRIKAVSEIGRLETEIARAREDAAKDFPLSDQLSDAQRRVADVEQQLQEAARMSAQANPPQDESARESEQVKIAARDFPEHAAVTAVVLFASSDRTCS